jgi:hypothetical protein
MVVQIKITFADGQTVEIAVQPPPQTVVNNYRPASCANRLRG